MEYLKSRRFLGMLFLIVTLIVGCVAMITVSKVNSQWRIFRERSLPASYWESTEMINVAADEASGTNDSWIVKAHDEQIGIFGLNGELEFVLDVYLFTLPDSDQAILRDGIFVSGRERLTALIEDYTG